MFFSKNKDIVWKTTDLVEVEYAACNDDVIDKWLIYDFSDNVALEIIKIVFKNSIDDDFIKQGMVEYLQNNEWIALDKIAIMGDNENELIYSLKEEFATNSFRINQTYSIDQVKFYKRKFNGLLVACRTDAFGSRMTAFITAMYLSKKLALNLGTLGQN